MMLIKYLISKLRPKPKLKVRGVQKINIKEGDLLFIELCPEASDCTHEMMMKLIKQHQNDTGVRYSVVIYSRGTIIRICAAREINDIKDIEGEKVVK